MFKNKRVLVTGGTGLIGRPLVDMLLQRGAEVRIVSLDDRSRANPAAEFKKLDLTHLSNAFAACEGMDYVFQLAGIKGSPAVTAKMPASFFFPTISFNTNMMEAARRCKVQKYLFTSSVGVYAPAEVFYEDDVWKTFPSPNDRFAGWAKRMGELQAEAYRIENNWKEIHIVRPANVYGPYDNFDPVNAMVISSIVRRAIEGENPLVCWGDGSPIRDFIHAHDAARGMLAVAENGITEPVNLGSGEGVTIRQIVEIVVSNLDKKPEVIWDTSKPAGDAKRLLSTERAKSIGFKPGISIEQGIKDVMAWYKENRGMVDSRYNVFRENMAAN